MYGFLFSYDRGRDHFHITIRTVSSTLWKISCLALLYLFLFLFKRCFNLRINPIFKATMMEAMSARSYENSSPMSKGLHANSAIIIKYLGIILLNWITFFNICVPPFFFKDISFDSCHYIGYDFKFFLSEIKFLNTASCA